jgi:hypothetical protein
MRNSNIYYASSFNPDDGFDEVLQPRDSLNVRDAKETFKAKLDRLRTQPITLVELVMSQAFIAIKATLVAAIGKEKADAYMSNLF